jgi:hypothetical protein
MKTNLIMVVAMILLYGQSKVDGSLAYIAIDPLQPTTSDIIRLSSGGYTSNNFLGIDYTNFLAQGNNLQWDIYYSMGSMAIINNWNSSQTIGTLSPGPYDLTVRVFASQGIGYSLDGTEHEAFNVVPEPVTLVLLFLGGVMLRKHRN